jgi:Sulfotransferase domain
MIDVIINNTAKALRKLDPRRKIIFDSGDDANTIFIAGAARSGTTWLQNIVNYDSEYRIIFEPFHSKKVNLVSHFNFRQYLSPANKDLSFYKPTKLILSGGIRNDWVDNFNAKFFAKKRLIKDVRANLMLKWIKVNFPYIPMIFIIRHPCAVAVSRRERGFETHLKSYLSQELLMIDHLKPLKSIIENVTCMFEKHILMWCIEHYVLLRQFKKNEIHILFYEDLCIDPYIEIRKISTFLNKQLDIDSRRLKNVINKPSPLSRKKSAIVEKKDLINDWKTYVSDSEFARAMELIRLFKLDYIYSDDAMPIIKSTDDIFRV